MAELGQIKPFFVMRAGSRLSDNGQGDRLMEREYVEQNLAAAQRMTYYKNLADAEQVKPKEWPSFSQHANSQAGPHAIQGEYDNPPSPGYGSSVECFNYWLLAAQPASPHAANAWYNPDGSPRLMANVFKQWRIA